MVVSATEGILVTCDVAMKQYILHLDELERQQNPAGIIISADLDDTHVLVRQSHVDFINQKVDELLSTNSFSRVNEPFAEARREREQQAALEQQQQPPQPTSKRKRA
jgi:hypothetical protein